MRLRPQQHILPPRMRMSDFSQISVATVSTPSPVEGGGSRRICTGCSQTITRYSSLLLVVFRFPLTNSNCPSPFNRSVAAVSPQARPILGGCSVARIKALSADSGDYPGETTTPTGLTGDEGICTDFRKLIERRKCSEDRSALFSSSL